MSLAQQILEVEKAYDRYRYELQMDQVDELNELHAEARNCPRHRDEKERRKINKQRVKRLERMKKDHQSDNKSLERNYQLEINQLLKSVRVLFLN